MNELTKGHPTDAGIDIALEKDVHIPAHSGVTIELSVANLDLPAFTAGLIFIRSKWAHLPILIQNPPIDAHYTGPLHVWIHNFSDEDIVLFGGIAYFQLVVFKIIHPALPDVEIKDYRPRAAERDTTR